MRLVIFIPFLSKFIYYKTAILYLVNEKNLDKVTFVEETNQQIGRI